MRFRFEEHWTLQAIATHFGIGRERVRQLIGNTGRILNNKMMAAERRVLEHHALSPNLKVSELSRILGKSPSWVSRVLIKNGVNLDAPEILEGIFWSHVDIQGANECWPWKNVRTRQGYGTKKVSGKWVYSHRMAYEYAFGPIPDGLLVCHKCDNPPCCNPNHLFLGTGRDNVRDAISKGRWWHQKPYNRKKK